ncbi:DUF4238 domain-containing protein [Pararoseomonas sp. SCSIO 73927]|uniref:DUF4238 domain-containing protein n=1 Tax=Pararoseomonas sp. SCSIO 73927 TaxID=3114537 RepID=UPI0030CED7A7
MAGRKQHYIPQFLLRGFGASAGKAVRVTVYSKGRGIYTTSTQGVGAERDFYSDPPGTEEVRTLDDQITDHENKIAGYVNSLRSLNEHDTIDPDRVAECVCHFLIRTAHLREVFSSSFAQVMANVTNNLLTQSGMAKFMKLDEKVPAKAVRDVLRKYWRENKEAIRTQGMSQDAFERAAYNEIKKVPSEQLFENLPMFRGLALEFAKGIPGLARKAHQEALTQTLVPVPRVESLRKLNWSILSGLNGAFVMPDCVILAENRDGEILPAFFVGQDEQRRIIMPISHNRLLIGGPSSPLLDPDMLNLAAARCSWEYFVALDEGPYQHLLGEIGGDVNAFLSSVLGN